MMKTAVILAGGEGRRIWPFADIRNKAMIPVANKPLLAYSVQVLIELKFERIIIAAVKFSDEIKNYFKNETTVKVVGLVESAGSSDTLTQVRELIPSDSCLVLYGDTLIDKKDYDDLWNKDNKIAVLLRPIAPDEAHSRIAVKVDDGNLQEIIGHPRRSGYDHEIVGFKLDKQFIERYAVNTSMIFNNLQVGMMPPEEKYLENALIDCLRAGQVIAAVSAVYPAFNLDYPWDILAVNAYMIQSLCSQIGQSSLADGASISESAKVSGNVRLGINSHIGPNVVIKGNVVVGDNSIITNGAILTGDIIIGDDCLIENYCYISPLTVIGDGTKVKHCAEVEGVVFPRVALGHYMEVQGIIGSNTDIGAGTVFGSLRFDDGRTIHNIGGEKIMPVEFSNAVYIGDFVRTGVNTVIMPGVKVGSRSIVGANVLLERDLSSNKIVTLKQELVEKDWSSKKYGW